MLITFDIETIPSRLDWARDELAAGIKAPATYKKAESIAEWERENKPAAVDEALAKTSFDGGLGQIVCIGWAFDDSAPQSITPADLGPAAEATMLRQWFEALRDVFTGTSGQRPVLVGFNHVSFDIPFVWKRCMVHGVRPPLWFPRDPKPWGESTFDCMTAWSGLKDRVSMDRLCKILGIPGKEGMTGADVWPAVQAGKIEEVASYCRGDVARTRAIYKRLTFAESL